MVKVRGINIFPSQIYEFLKNIEGVSGEYQVLIDDIFHIIKIINKKHLEENLLVYYNIQVEL